MSVPLAERIRPKTLDDIVGQTHLLGENLSDVLSKAVKYRI